MEEDELDAELELRTGERFAAAKSTPVATTVEKTPTQTVASSKSTAKQEKSQQSSLRGMTRKETYNDW